MSIPKMNILPTSIILATLTILSVGLGSYALQSSFAHIFSPDESAHFLTTVDQIKVESNLSANSMGIDDSSSSAQIHANNALLAYDHHTQEELEERNERVATELYDTLNQLLEEVNSGADKAQLDGTVETIDAILEEAVTIRIDEEQLNNSTIHALVFASIVDTSLQNYGDAFNLDIDLTDMSNMNKSITFAQGVKNGNSEIQIINSTNYESALGFSDNALDKFYNEISSSSIITGDNTKNEYVAKLENGLIEFKNALTNKENPMDVMKIVHTNIHPNLQILFELESK